MPLNIDLYQILLHLFNLTLLTAALYFLLYAPVKKFMDHRNDTLKKMISDAKGQMEEANRLKAEYCARLENVEMEVEAMYAQARAAIEAEVTQIRAAAREEAERIIAHAHEIGKTENDAV